MTRRRQRLKDRFEQTSGDGDWDVSRHVRMAQTDVAPRYGGSIDVAAEQPVPEHGHLSIVRVRLHRDGAVVPTVQFRRIHEITEHAAGQLHVRVRQDAGEQIKRRIPLGDFRRDADEDRDWRAYDYRFDDVDRMKSPGVDDGQPRCTMVQGVKSPQ